MRTASIIALLAVALVAPAQESSLRVGNKTFALGNAKLVAGEVSEASWSPDGTDLAYVIRQDGTTQVGLFNLKKSSGAVVAFLKDTEQLDQLVWLSTGHKALLMTHRNVEGRPVPTDLVSIRVADGEQMKSHELWSSEFPSSDGATVDVKPSPSLAHAIITVRAAKTKLFLVLTQDAKAIVQSQDMADADKAGQDVAGWSVNGTAILNSERVAPGLAQATDNDVNAQMAAQLLKAYFAAVESTVKLQPGDSVYECVPSNGVLRPIRFPGFYEAPPSEGQPLKVCLQSTEAHMGQTSIPMQSLWLVLTGRTSEPNSGLLVSAEVGGGWLSPTGREIAFLTQHALFVRRIEIKN